MGNRDPIGVVAGDAAAPGASSIAGDAVAGDASPIAGDAVTRGASAKGMVLNLSRIMTAASEPPRLPLRQPGSDTTLRKLWHIPDAT